MNSHQKRQPAGNPRGGQFAPMGRFEEGAALVDTQEMTIPDPDQKRAEARKIIQDAGGLRAISERFGETGDVTEEVRALAYPFTEARRFNEAADEAERLQYEYMFSKSGDSHASFEAWRLSKKYEAKAKEERQNEAVACWQAGKFFAKAGEANLQEMWDQLAAKTMPNGEPKPAEHSLSEDGASGVRKTVESAGGVEEIVRKYRRGELSDSSPEMEALRLPYECEIRNSNTEQRLVRRKNIHEPAYLEQMKRVKRENFPPHWWKDPDISNYTKIEDSLDNLKALQKEDNTRIVSYLESRASRAQAIWDRDLEGITIGRKSAS